MSIEIGQTGRPLAADAAPPLEPVVGISSGTTEAVIADAVQHLEDAAESAREQEQSSRKMRSQMKRRAISQQRTAAVLELAGTVVGASGKAAAGIASGSEGGRAKRTSASSEGVGDIAKGALSFAASKRKQDAALSETVADEAASRASASGSHAETLERFADKAMGHQETIARAKHDERMAALRG